MALLIRVVYLIQYQQSAFWDQLTVDNWYHHNWANSLAEGNIFGDTTYFRAPFYVYLLGLLYGLLGNSLWTARIFGLVVGLASVMMTYLLGRKLVDRRTGLIAACLHAVYPIMIYFDGELLLDSLFMLLVQVTVYRFLRWLDLGKSRQLLWTGLACGLAAITRPTALVAVPLVLAWVLALPGLKTRFAQGAMFLLGLTLVIAPVFLRNVIVAEDPVLVSSQGGVNLYIGNNETSDGFSAAMPEPMGHNWDIAQITWLAQKDLGRALKPGEVSDYWRDRALAWMARHPGPFLRLYLKKIYSQIGDLEISNNRSLRAIFEELPLLRYNPLHFCLMFAVAVLGLVTSWRRHRGMAFVLLFMGIYILAVSLFFYNSRFRLPLLPLYFVLAGAGLGLLKDQWRARSGKLVLSLLLAVGAGVLSLSTTFTIPYGRSPQSDLAAGLADYRNLEFETALTHFRAARVIDSAFPEVNLNIGACHFRLGRPDSARFYFNQEKELHPGRVKGYHNLASFALVNGAFREAQAFSRAAVEIAPYDVTANILLVRALGADSAVVADSLLAEISSAMERTANDLFLLNEAAAVLSRRGNLKWAEKISRTALEAEPPPIETDPLAFRPEFRHARTPFAREKARTWHLLGYIAGVDGRLEEAVDCSRQALLNDPEFAEAYLNLVTALEVAGRRAEADSVLSEARQRFPDSLLLRISRPHEIP